MSKITPMYFEGDVPKNWFRWRRLFERHMSTQEWKDLPKDEHAMKFIVAFGEKALGICIKLNLSQAEMSDVDTLMLKFEEHLAPRKNLTQRRHVLFNQRQERNETVEEYVKLLKRLAEECEFEEMEEEVVKTVFIGGIRDDICKRKLLESDRSWDEAVRFAFLAEQINETCKEMCDKAGLSGVDKDKLPSRSKNDKDGDSKSDKGERKFCTFCGQKHERGNCPAYKKVCSICKKQNHFAKMCRNKKTDSSFVMV